jgi:tetratricopeptide (TPR) repeat protein
MINPLFNKLCHKRLPIAGVYVLVALLLSSCASTPMSEKVLSQPPPYLQSSVELTDVPFFAQEEFQCGPAALATLLAYTDINTTPEVLAPKVFLPRRKGTLQIELLTATRRYGRLPYRLEPSLEKLLAQVKAGKPVLVLQNLGVNWIPRWHYAVVVGYDLHQQKLLLRSGTIKRYQLDMTLFERTWQRSDHWAFVALRPGELPADDQELAYFHTVSDFEKNQSTGDIIKAYQAGLQRWPSSNVLGMGLGNALYQSGVLAKAAASYNNVLSRHPNYAPAHNNLAQVLMELGKLADAKKHAEKAVSLGGNHLSLYQSTLDDIISRLPVR